MVLVNTMNTEYKLQKYFFRKVSLSPRTMKPVVSALAADIMHELDRRFDSRWELQQI
jgi:hypothetical protein